MMAPTIGPLHERKPKHCMPVTEPSDTTVLSISATEKGTGKGRPRSKRHRKSQPNYWEQIVKRHATNLKYLPVPPRHFVQRERKASRNKKRQNGAKKRQNGAKTSLKLLLRGDKQHEALPTKANGCLRWALLPMTEKPPEPLPGVPTVTVTTPEGETCWPKDINSYISRDKANWITERVTKQHHGPHYETHCALFQELHRRGLDNKPLGHRPEILFCIACWTRQEEIEEESLAAFEQARQPEESGG